MITEPPPTRMGAQNSCVIWVYGDDSDDNDVDKKSNLIQIYIIVLFFWANVPYLTGANVPFLEQMGKKNHGANVSFTGQTCYI